MTAQEPTLHIRTSKLGNKSFELEYAVTTKKGEELIVHATGNTTQIMFDMKTRTTMEIPDWVREALRGFDGLGESNEWIRYDCFEQSYRFIAQMMYFRTHAFLPRF